MKTKLVVVFLVALATHAQARSMLAKDLAADVATALAAVDNALAEANQLFTTLNGVDDTLMFQVQVLVGNIILQLYSVGVGGTDLQNLQTIINNAEAVTVYQIYLQAYAVLAHRDILTFTQDHLNSDLTQLTSDRDLLMTSQAELDTGFTTAFQLTEAEVIKFNTAINSYIEGMSGPEILQIRASLASVNRILSNTRQDIENENLIVASSTRATVAALDVVIAQLPAQQQLDDVVVVKHDNLRTDNIKYQLVKQDKKAATYTGCED